MIECDIRMKSTVKRLRVYSRKLSEISLSCPGWCNFKVRLQLLDIISVSSVHQIWVLLGGRKPTSNHPLAVRLFGFSPQTRHASRGELLRTQVLFRLNACNNMYWLSACCRCLLGEARESYSNTDYLKTMLLLRKLCHSETQQFKQTFQVGITRVWHHFTMHIFNILTNAGLHRSSSSSQVHEVAEGGVCRAACSVERNQKAEGSESYEFLVERLLWAAHCRTHSSELYKNTKGR